MNALVIGASGYIGGSVAARLLAEGYEIVGTTSSDERGEELKKLGIEPAVGSYKDPEFIKKLLGDVDIVINCADSDARGLVETVLDVLTYDDGRNTCGLKNTGKKFIHTSGSSIVSDTACGEPSDKVYDEETPFQPVPQKEARVAIDQMIRDAAKNNVHTIIICPCMIYGRGLGLSKESIQIPAMINQAKKSKISRCIGRGFNIWSTVHIEDLVDLYSLAASGNVPAGEFLFAENGEVRFYSLAAQIKKSLDLSAPVEEWPIEDAIKEWGEGMAKFALGSNSRIRGKRSRELGWKPTRNNVLEDVDRMCSSADMRVAAH